jgi:hypothetical protein
MSVDKSKMKLRRETRWHREYETQEPGHFFVESKFRDGSVTITLPELKEQWGGWSDWERIDFCQELCQAGCPDLPDVLRFIMANGEPQHWSGIALDIVHHLPADEAITFLFDAYAKSDSGGAGNIIQALSKSGAPEAHKILRKHLQRLWQDPGLFTEEEHINTVAADAAHCLEHLLNLGEPAEEFRDHYEALLRHPTQSNRQIAQNFLTRHFAS